MRPQKGLESEPRKRTRKKALKLILAVIVILILLAFFAVPAFVSSSKGQKIILAKINDSLNGHTDFASLSMSWFKGVKVSNVSFDDNAGQTSLRVKLIDTKPHYASIMMGRLSFGKTIIDEPRVKINLQNRLNKTAQAARQKPSPEKKTQLIVPPLKKIDLVVNNGSLKVTGPQAETVELSQVNSHLNLRPPGSQTDFDIDMAVLGKNTKSNLHADGRITPNERTGWSLEGTTGDLTVQIDDLDVGSLTPLLALAGVDVEAKGRISADVKSEIKDGQVESLSGTIKGTNLDVTGPALKGDRFRTDRLDVGVKLRSDRQMINIDQLDIQGDWLNARISGVVPTTFQSLAELVKPGTDYALNGTFQCDLAQALSQMPRTFGLKEGLKVTSGQLSGSVGTSTEAGKKKISGSANLVGLKGFVDDKAIALSEPMEATAQITSDKTRIKYDKLGVSAPFGRINCTGTGKLLEYNADINLAEFQMQLGQFVDTGPYQMAGQLSSTGKISSDKNKVTAVGSSKVKNLRLTKNKVSASEPAADIDFALDIDRQAGTIEVNSIEAAATLGRFRIKDSIIPTAKKPAKPMKLTISASDVDLQKLQPFAVLFASFPEEMEMAGTAQSTISVSSQKDTYRIASDTTKIKNFKLQYPQQQPLEQQEVELVFDAEVNPTKKAIAVTKFQLTSPKIKIKGDFKKTTEKNETQLQGKADCEYDWAAVSTLAAPYWPEGLKIEGQQKDTIEFFSKYPADKTDGLLANLNTKGKLSFEKASYMGLNFSPTEADLQVQNGFFTIAPFSTTVNGGQFNFAGSADFKQDPTLLKTPKPIQIAKEIHINKEMAKKLLMYVNPIFADIFDVSGVANFHCERLAIPLPKPDKQHIEVVGTISADNLRLQASDLLGLILSVADTKMKEQKMTLRPTRFVLQNGFLTYDDMQVDIGDNPVNFKGTIGIEDNSLNMTVTLPYTTIGRTARIGKVISGERISLPLKGTIDKPELDLGKLIEEQLKQRLQQEMQKALEGLFK